MKLLITGGCGYVGTELIKSLLKKNYKIINVDNQWFGNFLPKHKNLKNLKLDIRQIEKINFIGIDAIVHLAGVANDPSAELNEKLSWDINVLATKFLIEKAIKFKVKKFIFASSGSVYGIKKETEVTEDLTLKPISIYNKTKMIAENVLMSYKDQIQVFCIRPATVCGYSDRMRFDVSVNMLTYQALAKKQITVFGGNQIRPNIHIKDMVRVYDFFLTNKKIKTDFYNAGFENISIKDLAYKINKIIPSKIKIVSSNDPRSYRQSSKKLLSLGFIPKYSVEDAILDLKQRYQLNKLVSLDKNYNVKWMKLIKIDGKRN
jgi:nucleoside-diphosphate-sugar epimerase